MKKQIVLFVVFTLCLIFAFTFCISASSSNEFSDNPETSDKIDLTGMSTDTKARVVLFDGEEYHTYPSQYIVTDKGDMGYDFQKINEAFEKSYGVSSVIRIEIPNTVKVVVGGLFNYGKNNNLKEVYFPADSQVYKFNWGCFEQNTGLEKINIPASLTEWYGTNHFAKCTALKEVIFEDGIKIKTLPDNFFLGCTALEHIVLPNSLENVGGGLFGSCTGLKTVRFGANFKTMVGPVSDSSTCQTWFIPASFFGKNVETEPTSTMFHWQGSQNNNLSGTNHGPSNITFVFTGTKDEALALMARCKAADALNGEECIGLSELYNAVLCTEAEYETLTGVKVGEGATGNYFIYDYSVCDAFYNSKHTVAEVFNSFEGADYLTPYKTYSGCGRCPEKEEIGTVCDALFIYKGFSTDGEGVFYGVDINNDAIVTYNQTTKGTLKYGVVISQIYNEGKLINNEGAALDSVVRAVKLSGAEYISAQIKILNLANVIKEVPLHCCAYIIDGDEIKYLYDTTDLEGNISVNVFDKANTITYSDIDK